MSLETLSKIYVDSELDYFSGILLYIVKFIVYNDVYVTCFVQQVVCIYFVDFQNLFEITFLYLAIAHTPHPPSTP